MIEIWVGAHLVLRTWATGVEQIATLHVAAIRRFRDGGGFPATFIGYDNGVDRQAAGHRTVWFSPSVPVVFDYGTDYEPTRIDESEVARAMEEMDTSELGVIVVNAHVPSAFAAEQSL